MDSNLFEELEKHLPGLQDSDLRELNAFEDSDLSMYPAIEIPEVHLSADHCETMANNLIRMMDRCESASMIEAAAGIAILAYNSFMDRNNKYLGHDGDPEPFFHKYNSRVFTEHWLRTKGLSTIDIENLRKPQTLDSDGRDSLALELVDPNASEFERKSSIGVWAFCHLRVFRSDSRRRLRSFFEIQICNPDNKIMKETYGFRGSYRFPTLNDQVYKLLRSECCYNKPGELMYLFYRGAIILDRAFDESKLRQQKKLLMGLAFGGHEDGLLYSGLGLVSQARFVVDCLDITFGELFSALSWALKDPSWVKYSAGSLKTVEILREFHSKYERHVERKNRYYKYARVVNHYYFYWLSSNCNQELIHALRRLCWDSRTDYNAESVYVRWGELMAAKIQDNLRIFRKA